MQTHNYLIPDWPAPDNIRAFTSQRNGGYSQPPFDSFNLAPHVGDDPTTLSKNITKLIDELTLPHEPIWLNQVHGTTVINIAQHTLGTRPEADACITQQPQTICSVLTADCLPILLCNQSGSEVAAIHAGWRGLLAGVIDATLEQMNSPMTDVLAWLGPAIGPGGFVVNDQIKVDFTQANPDNRSAFIQTNENEWHGNLYEMAKITLQRYGVTQIYGGEHCTFTETERFFSYRRHNTTGRMASLIWIAE